MTRRLLVSYLTVTAVILILLGVPLAAVLAEDERLRFQTAVERDTSLLASLAQETLTDAAAGAPADFPEEFVRTARAYEADAGARTLVVDSDGIVLFDTEGRLDADYSTRPELADALASDRSVGSRRSDTLGQDLLYVALPVRSSGGVLGAVRVTIDNGRVEANVARIWVTLTLVAGVVFLAMSVIGWVLSRSVSRPIRDLSVATHRLAEGDLSVRVDPGNAPSEVKRLADDFGGMAEQLSRVLARQRAFISDASHELRSPLTALRLRLENAEADATDSSRPDLEAAIDETVRLSGLVDQLLALTRAESGRLRVATIDIVDVVEARVETWTGRAEELGIEIKTRADVEPTSEITTVAGAVESTLDNFLANAVAVAPSGSTVTVHLQHVDARYELHVIDRGPGLTAEQRVRAFDRFWRGDQSTPGTGIGLAIVAALVTASDGEVQLRPHAEGGTDAVAMFPDTAQPREPA